VQVDGKNNASLPSPDSNGGNLPAGYVYTKYDWSLYHHEARTNIYETV
jgi:rhamnogalacturonan endolyase